MSAGCTARITSPRWVGGKCVIEALELRAEQGRHVHADGEGAEPVHVFRRGQHGQHATIQHTAETPEQPRFGFQPVIRAEAGAESMHREVALVPGGLGFDAR